MCEGVYWGHGGEEALHAERPFVSLSEETELNSRARLEGTIGVGGVSTVTDSSVQGGWGGTEEPCDYIPGIFSVQV